MTRANGVTTRHLFSFGEHYDPGNISYGWLVAHNDETLDPGRGFESHHHRDVEIVTWVLHGVLEHQDSVGGIGGVSRGTVQRLSAGSGVDHAEVAAGSGPCRRIQMWVTPGSIGGKPTYAEASIDDLALASGPVVVASGGREHREAGGVMIGQPGAALSVARLNLGQCVVVPGGDMLHLYVASGAVALEGVGALEEGDSVQAEQAGGVVARATVAAEILVWHMRGSDPSRGFHPSRGQQVARHAAKSGQLLPSRRSRGCEWAWLG